MAQELVFHKYQGSDSDYLVYDINKNHMELNDSMVRKIRNRSFGADLAGRVARWGGSFFDLSTLASKKYSMYFWYREIIHNISRIPIKRKMRSV